MNATAINGHRINVAERPVPGRFARDVANRYLRMVSAYWSGIDTGMCLESWLARYRTTKLPSKPARPDDAYSPHGGGGHGIHWIEANQTVFGYINGLASGYAIPFSAVTEDDIEPTHAPPEVVLITMHSGKPAAGSVPPVRVIELDDHPTGHEYDQHIGFDEFDASL